MNPPRWQPPVRRRLYLMRHGDVTYFDATGKPVRPDAVPLNDEGCAQAASTALDFAEIPFDRVVCSGLPRTLQTAQIVTNGRGLPVEVDGDLREIEPGRLRELPLSDMERHFLGAFGVQLDRGTQFLGGETFGSLLDRVLPALHRLLDDPSWKHLLIVAHGGVNRVILAHALGLGLHAFAALEQDPCCVSILDVLDGGRFIVRLVNHTCYNPSKRGLELTTMERLYQQFRGPPL